MLSAFKWALIVFGALALGLAALVLFSIWQQAEAETKATGFCAQSAIGADVASLVARADAMGVKRHYPWCDAKRHVFFFQGSTFNGFDCVLAIEGGKVAAKHVAERLDEDAPDKVCQ